MKKHLVKICALVIAAASMSFAAEEAKSASADAPAASNNTKKMTPEEKEYLNLYGMVVAKQTGAKELKFTAEEVAVFFDGMKAYINGAPLPANAPTIGPKMQDYLNERAMAAAEEAVAKSRAEAEAFWKDIKANDKIQKSPSGLAFEILEAGDPKLPTPESTVVVKYTGKLINGTVFDSTELHGGEPASFPLNGVIEGFREGLQKIGKGGKIRLYIPSELGYKNQAVGAIPPGSTLIFDAEIVDIK
ncbi:MAG: FKBP-type peptidyl-prolyl cis-trans isomerase [Opitutales bacterium]|nr:FKBP-type peptidyl-prolyl cis-trans isomerase [Opitutales bacterium]